MKGCSSHRKLDRRRRALVCLFTAPATVNAGHPLRAHVTPLPQGLSLLLLLLAGLSVVLAPVLVGRR